jgi:hypothetical protein
VAGSEGRTGRRQFGDGGTAGVGAGVLAREDDGAWKISGGEAEELLLAEQAQAWEAVGSV